jgi:hypothetical protein
MKVATLLLLVSIAVRAQDQPPAGAPPAPQTPAPPPVLEYRGKPMLVPFRCTDEDMRSAGLSCSEDDPCAVYLELTAVASTGIRIYTAGNIHTSTATLYSILLGSDDNGHTWHESFDRLRASSYDTIQFADAENGWVSGLAVSPLPQDPFLLHTTDGGKTWRKANIFSETAYGSIQQFHFDDKSAGALIIDQGAGSATDRYARYESTDGGDTWSVKETNVKPLALKRPAAAPAPEWRARADANSRSYQIEHREGSRWTAAAAFAVNLGVCRPQ